MKKTYTRFLTGIIFFILPSAIWAQGLQGRVTDSKSGEALIGATILIKGSNQGASADMSGRFTIQNPGNPPLTLIISYIGYKTREVEVKDLSKPVNVSLEGNEEMLKEVEVVDVRLTEKQRESPLTVEALDLIAIKETPAANFYDGLGSLKGVDLTAASLGFKIINTRGFNSTSPVRTLQIIDGVDNQAPGLNFSLGNFLGSSELDVLKVDIIVGASSAFYGPNAFNGVISMTTKNPFDFPGLSVQARVGERNLRETAVRYAQKFQNKAGVDKFAFKVNAAYMEAIDWEADNMDATPQSIAAAGNPGGYDAVNRYGDEELGGYRNNYNASVQYKSTTPGLGIIHRDGYREKDLVDYKTDNIKLNAALHYRFRPDIELSLSSSFGTGSTIYQGENRFRLEDILFFQHKIELAKKDRFFVRAYATQEDAGKSYDVVVSAFELQNLSRSNDEWKTLYRNTWTQGGFNAPSFKVRQLPGYPAPFNEAVYDSLMAANYVRLTQLHDSVRHLVNNYAVGDMLAFFEPGTQRFDSAFSAIRNRTLAEGGSLLKDRSALYHIHGEYKWPVYKKLDLTVGGNWRLYRPNSSGTIFSDTLVIDKIENGDTLYKRRVITNSEFGAYAGLQFKFLADKLKLSVTGRVDKNQNFNWISTQSASGVYTYGDHTFRLVYSSAVRNPTLQDQYLYYNVGRATLLGNINGRDSLITIDSYFKYLELINAKELNYFNVAPLRPERVSTFEAGYRTTLFDRLFLDASYYYSIYTDFIGYKIGLDVDYTGLFARVKNVYRLASNTEDIVTTQGASAGFNYYFLDKYSLSGNYSWNVLARRDSTDEIITAFNTPEHKFNVGVNGRKIKLPWIKGENFGFNVNYKWIEGFTFEGSPQFTGSIPTYDLLDAQINWTVPKWKTQFKLGANNVLNNKVYMVYGGPLVGRLAYFSVLVEI